MIEENKLVCHKGYISIFPLLLGLVPADSPHLGALLDVMSDPAHLWSEYGLRSLSKSDEFYSTGENYWRGPIWANMNYLALSSLYKVLPSTSHTDVELHIRERSIQGESEEGVH
jgi:mannosyl-oligosaccharide glucosidase